MLESMNKLNVTKLTIDALPGKGAAPYRSPELTTEQWESLNLRYRGVTNSYDSLDLAIGLKYGFPEHEQRFALGEDYFLTYHRLTGRAFTLRPSQDEDLVQYASRLAPVKLLSPERFGNVGVSDSTWSSMVTELNSFRTRPGSAEADSFPYFARDLKILYPNRSFQLGFTKEDSDLYRENFIFPDEVLMGSFVPDHYAIYRLLYGGLNSSLPKEALLTPRMANFTEDQIEHLKANSLWDTLIKLAFNLRVLKAKDVQITESGLEITDTLPQPDYISAKPVLPDRRKF